MPTIELVYFSGCPNVEEARENIRAAVRGRELDASWVEWNLDESGTPARLRGYASPAVLVEGRHVLGDEPADHGANACRAGGAPPREAITAALEGDR